MNHIPKFDPELPPTSKANSRSWLKGVCARLATIILIALLPAFVLLMVIASAERTRAATLASAEQMALARLAGTQYMEMISSTEHFMSWAALFPEVRDGDSAACTQRLEQLYNELTDFRSMSVTGLDGATICTASTQPITGTLQLADRLYFRDVVKTRKFAIGGLDTGIALGRPNIIFGVPILDDNGALTRVLGAGLDVELLNQRLEVADFPDGAILILTDSAGRVILRSHDPASFVGQILPIAAQITDDAPGGGIATGTGLDGVERQYAWTTIDYNGEEAFHVLVGYSDQHIYGFVNRTLRASLIGLAMVTLMALLVAWLGARNMIVRRVDRLVLAANRMRDGNQHERTGLTEDPGEFGQLAIALEALAGSLEDGMRENQQLIAEMTDLNADLEARVAVRTRELEAAYTSLVASQAELRMLSQALMVATESERTRIARDIHDQLGQMITAIKIELSTLRKRVLAPNTANNASGMPEAGDGSNATIRAKIDDINLLLDEAVTVVRRISADLRPGVLDDFGLVAAAEAHLSDFEKQTDIGFELVADVDEALLSQDVATTAFRILQESLTNVVRHAEATHVSVAMKTQESLLSLRIEDNGRGITAEQFAARTSLGLLGMRERAAQLGGTLKLASSGGRGAVLFLHLPIALPHGGAGSNI